MARQSGIAVQNNFSKGLVTEATGLNFPQDAATETYNCIFDPSGFFERRRGINYEIDYDQEEIALGLNACTEYVWQNVAGLGSLQFVVIQVGNLLRFYEVTADQPLSAGLKTFTVNLNDFDIAGSPNVNRLHCQFAHGNGYLFVVHPYCSPFYIVYDPDDDTITTTTILMRIRDFEGIDESLETDERPTTLTDTHKYNLYNQGWYLDDVETDGANGNPVDLWNSARSDYPSNADVWWYYKSVDAETGEEYFNVSSGVNIKAMGNTEAPKGHYIMNPFNTNRYAKIGVSEGTLLEESSSFYRPSTVAFFAGRVWYAGVNYQQYASRVYFSQIITSNDQFGKCYQANDPTSENFSDLLPTDGGVINSPEIGTIYKLFPLEYSLIIFASNGIWAIGGSEGVGFRANDYSLRKISAVPSISGVSFVDYDGLPMWCNLSGIYTLAPDQVGDIKVQSLTDQTIKEFYQSIPPANRKFMKGVYDRDNNRVQWLYRTFDTNNNFFRYNGILNFNVLNGSWFPWQLSSITNQALAGAVAVSGNGATIVGGEVIATEFPSVVKFLVFTSTTDLFSFAEHYDPTYFDFTNEAYTSYALTGYAVEGQAALYFQSPWVMPYLETEDTPVAIDLYARWNYSNTGDSGKWSSIQRIEFLDDQYNYQTKRMKVRGRGRAMQLMIRSVDQYPFKCIGWSLIVSSNASP